MCVCVCTISAPLWSLYTRIDDWWDLLCFSASSSPRSHWLQFLKTPSTRVTGVHIQISVYFIFIFLGFSRTAACSVAAAVDTPLFSRWIIVPSSCNITFFLAELYHCHARIQLPLVVTNAHYFFRVWKCFQNLLSAFAPSLDYFFELFLSILSSCNCRRSCSHLTTVVAAVNFSFCSSPFTCFDGAHHIPPSHYVSKTH